jgi:DNA segregation ATPase FtsK/SpoIIIE, S-DNA-T family
MTLVQRSGRAAVAPATLLPPHPSRLLHPWAYRRSVRRELRQRHRRQRRAWEVQDVLAGVRPELIQYGKTSQECKTIHVPTVVAADDGPPQAFTIRALPGQTLAHYEAHAQTLAECLDVARARFVRAGPRLMRLELFETDPLLDDVPLPLGALGSAHGLLLLGVDDTGLRYRISPADMVHLAVQGATGSGKSVFTYGLIGQMLSTPEVLLAISDPSGLLTRPFEGTDHAPWQVSGTSEPDAHVWLLERLVHEMDTRIRTIPHRRDQVELGEDCPLIEVILEEYPGLLRALDDGRRAGGRVEKVKRLVGRLISEGRKAGIRLVILANRFEAAVVDGFTRDQCTVKVSFRVGNGDSIAMLHPTGRLEAEAHATAAAGVALLSGPGLALARIKSPYIGQPDGETAYAAYWDLVTARSARLPDSGT